MPAHMVSPHIQAQSILRRRLSGKDVPFVHGLKKEKKQLYDLVHRTAVYGESNSILVIGPPGVGKTMLVNNVTSDILELKEAKENLMIVRLNGLVQTDDRLALKDITRQLALENTVGDKVFGTFAENLQFLLDALKSGGKQSKSILFILEEFDLFAHHKNQTLLYNLLDVSQSAQSPICVLGLTSRLDVIELFEKRVKSRFSHRQLHLLPGFTLVDFLKIFISLLSLPETFPDKEYMKRWNLKVKEISDNVSIQDLLRRQYNLSREIRPILSLLMLPVCRVTEHQPFLSVADFVESGKILGLDSKAAMLHGVSVLELCLIIAMKHLTETYNGEPFNFEMVYAEYKRFCTKKSAIQLFDKAIVMKAYEHLCALEFIGSAEGIGVKTQKEYKPQRLLVDGTQIMEAMQKYPNCPTEVMQWASSSLF